MIAFLAAALLASSAAAQTFRRTPACPKLGCLFPPDQVEFIAGQSFDIRVEAQAPRNGSEAYNNGVPDENFTVTIAGHGGKAVSISQFFSIPEPSVKRYNFTYFEDLFAQQNGAVTPVNVLSKTYRNVQLHQPGKYDVVFTYNNGMTTTACWEVRATTVKKAKNAIIFIGDGMATSMISAARLLAHKTINGKYQTKLKMDEAPGYGAQMTHSLDSFITDSANSASALFTGKKMTVNGLNAYTDSTGKGFDNAQVETVFEMFRRITGGQVGIVSKAYIADATPAAVCTHTSQRAQYTAIIEQYLNGVTGNYSWFPWQGVDLLFGGGAENFLAGPGNGNVSQIDRWQKEAGYAYAANNTQLQALDNSKRALGLFTRGNVSTWLDQHVYTDALNLAITPDGKRGAYDQPGLKDMTLKAIDILHTRAKERNTGFMLMSEAALIDKEMHVQDVDRALGDLLELDDTLRATLEHLKEIGELEDTLVVVTADHGHGFDVYGSADTEYLAAQNSDRAKRGAVGVYAESGVSAYTVPKGVNPSNHTEFDSPQGSGFPVTWDPRWTIAHGYSAFPDKREDFAVNKDHERVPATRNATGYFFNPEDNVKGFAMSGNIGTGDGQGVHSLVDVPIYSFGPGHECFRGVMGNIDIAFNIADVMGLGQTSNVTSTYKK